MRILLFVLVFYSLFLTKISFLHDFSVNSIGNAGVVSIATALAVNPTLTSLNLSCKCILFSLLLVYRDVIMSVLLCAQCVMCLMTAQVH